MVVPGVILALEQAVVAWFNGSMIMVRFVMAHMVAAAAGKDQGPGKVVFMQLEVA
jgi:hypothetical protein